MSNLIEQTAQSSLGAIVPTTSVLIQQTESSLAVVKDVLREGEAEDAFEHGKSCYKNKSYIGAVRAFSKAVMLKPEWIEAHQALNKAESYLRDYNTLQEHGLMSTSLLENADSYYWRSVEKRKLGDLEGTIYDLTKAIELNSEYSNAYNNRAFARRATGDLEGALADFNKVIELSPQYSTPYRNRGAFKRDFLNDLDGAKSDFTKAAESSN